MFLSVSETEDRPVISAPSKDQGQMEAPMPKINTLLPSKTNEPQPGTSKISEPYVSPRKEKEHTESQQKREPNDQSSSLQKKEEKERSVSPQKREPVQKSSSPQKRESEHKAPEAEKKLEEEKNKHVPRPATKVSGTSCKTTFVNIIKRKQTVSLTNEIKKLRLVFDIYFGFLLRYIRATKPVIACRDRVKNFCIFHHPLFLNL